MMVVANAFYISYQGNSRVYSEEVILQDTQVWLPKHCPSSAHGNSHTLDSQVTAGRLRVYTRVTSLVLGVSFRGSSKKVDLMVWVVLKSEAMSVTYMILVDSLHDKDTCVWNN
ncbi:hypothetical protein QJS10_CPA02g01429 [Acorus calamus]|uniref:Uncharacterized protein n=1 Tax=Acorus calamus TaxID=4465 RepID=A0AAV9FD26_ACOCL|nr:hypothetical protein QJS10_CPA02g01429 [Acorus calamus]